MVRRRDGFDGTATVASIAIDARWLGTDSRSDDVNDERDRAQRRDECNRRIFQCENVRHLRS